MLLAGVRSFKLLVVLVGIHGLSHRKYGHAPSTTRAIWIAIYPNLAALAIGFVQFLQFFLRQFIDIQGFPPPIRSRPIAGMT